jgi:hypothetical protein
MTASATVSSMNMITRRPIRLTASASRRHDVPSATSDVLSATSNPNDGDGYAWRCGRTARTV